VKRQFSTAQQGERKANLLYAFRRLEITPDRLTTINTLSVLSDYLEARLDETPFETNEEVRQVWHFYDDFYRAVMEMKSHERVIFSDERMFRLRKRIERAEAEFRCYNEMLEKKAQEWSPALSVLTASGSAPR
jgi:hypothetical protein